MVAVAHHLLLLKGFRMSEILIYHNPRCTKSRQALDLLHKKGLEPRVIEYLKDIPTKKELKKILSLLGISANDLIRKSEMIYKENFKDKELTESEWIDAMIAYPKLIERPIVVRGNKAIIGRPTEKVLDII